MSALLAITRYIDTFNSWMGRLASWALVFMVLLQLLVVILRYVFGLGFIMMQESVIYLHALAFVLSVGYTMAVDGHVRVDVFYQAMSHKNRSIVNMIGSVFMLLPFVVVLFMHSAPYVENSWSILEKSRESSGLPFLYLLKSLILVLVGLIFLQGISLFVRSLAVWLGVLEHDEPLHRLNEEKPKS